MALDPPTLEDASPGRAVDLLVAAVTNRRAGYQPAYSYSDFIFIRAQRDHLFLSGLCFLERINGRGGLWKCGNLALFARFPRGGGNCGKAGFAFPPVSTDPSFPRLSSSLHPASLSLYSQTELMYRNPSETDEWDPTVRAVGSRCGDLIQGTK